MFSLLFLLSTTFLLACICLLLVAVEFGFGCFVLPQTCIQVSGYVILSWSLKKLRMCMYGLDYWAAYWPGLEDHPSSCHRWLCWLCDVNKLHLLVATTFGQRTRPFAIGLTFWPLGRPRGMISVRLDLYEARPALHAQIIARIVVELERRDQAVGRIARIRTLRFA